MRALITGASGQLARQLISSAPTRVEPLATSRSECDITDASSVERVFSAFRPDVVLNTAAYTAVDAAEDAPGIAFGINAHGAQNVARAAEMVGARLIHISTDYVFDGERSSPYPADAATNPLNVYGASKLEGERLVFEAAPSALVIRAGWLYSSQGKNFLVTILRSLRTSKPLRVVRDQIGCPTSAREFADTIWKATEADLRGVYHWANAGSASWYDFAVEIADLAQRLGLFASIPAMVGITTEEYGSRAKRPRYSVLDSKRLAHSLNKSPATWEDALLAEIRETKRLQ